MNRLVPRNHRWQLVALALGLILGWPGPWASGDGDGVGILPRVRVDPEGDAWLDGRQGFAHQLQGSAAVGFIVSGELSVTPDAPPAFRRIDWGRVFPIRSGPVSWWSMATTIARSKSLAGHGFAVGCMGFGVDGRPAYLVVAVVAGGSGKLPVVLVKRL